VDDLGVLEQHFGVDVLGPAAVLVVRIVVLVLVLFVLVVLWSMTNTCTIINPGSNPARTEENHCTLFLLFSIPHHLHTYVHT
jgi:hypothetical protein